MRTRSAVGGGIILLLLVGSVVAARADDYPPPWAEGTNAPADLYPGGLGSLRLRIVNPRPSPLTVMDLAQNGAAVPDPAHASCGTGVVQLVPQTGLALAVPAKDERTFSLPGIVRMSTSAPAACEGALFKFPVQFSGTLP